MTSTVPEPKQGATDDKGLVEMAWDPITRIVGSLGIYTKVDFKNKTVAECHSTSSIFRGYSLFMKGKDPRDAHFITSRICGICGDNHATCSCYAQNMAYGVQPPHLGEWIANLGEAAEYMFDHNIFQENLVRRRLLREDGLRDQSRRAGDGREDRGTAFGRTRVPDGRRHHARTQPVHGRVLPRGVAHQSTHPRDVLSHGGSARPPVDAVSGWCRHRRDRAVDHRLHDAPDALHRVHEEGRADARRPVRLLLRGALPGYEHVGERRTLLGCWGAFQIPRCATSRTRT